jgi:signal peptidase I
VTLPDAALDETSSDEKPTKRSLPWWLESLGLLAVALVLSVLIKTFFLQAFYIPSPSMQPQLVLNDRILVQKVSYWGGGTPQRGDIVVFADPGHWLDGEDAGTPSNPVTRALSHLGLYPSGGHLVKRVIGVGGDRVDCASAKGPLEVNGHPLDEAAYLPRNAKPCANYGAFHVQVPSGRLWVMGDNRADSADSRAHLGDPGGGMVPVHLVVGKVFALVWPLGRAQLIHRPADFAGIPDAG